MIIPSTYINYTFTTLYEIRMKKIINVEAHLSDKENSYFLFLILATKLQDFPIATQQKNYSIFN